MPLPYQRKYHEWWVRPVSVFLDLKITEAGKQAAFNAASTGVDVKITHVAFGDSYKAPDGTETQLIHEIKRVVVGGGSRVTNDQVRIWGLWASDTETGDIREVGIYAGTVLFAYYSRAEGTLIGRKTTGGDFVFYYDWKLSQIPTEVVTIVVDPSAATAIAVLHVHEQDLMAHNHFMRRASMAQEGETFKWGGLAAGTATVIELTLPFESLLTTYVPGQVFRFIAQYGNSGPVGLRVNGLELRSVRKYGQTALVSGDLIKGSIYEVTFDGSNFQLNSGIGGSAETVTPEGDVFFVHSFTATAGQTSFEVAYNVGALMVFRGGDIVQPEDFTATDGLNVVFPTGSTAGQEVVVVTFRALAASNVYTKPQTYSRAEVGSLLNDKQNSLGFVPVRQGGGVGQGNNVIRLGMGADGLLAQVDNVQLGKIWTQANFDPDRKVDKPITTHLDISTQLQPYDLGEIRVTVTANMSITLPSAAGLSGEEITIRRMSNNTNFLQVATANENEMILFNFHLSSRGYRFFYLLGAGDFWTLRSDGSDWLPVSRLDGSFVGKVDYATSIAIPSGGYGLASGQLLGRADWPWLWDHARLSGMLVADTDRVGNEGCWTSGNGSTTFRVPEIRGEFVRVWDEYRGVDANRGPGTWKAGEMAVHTHTVKEGSIAGITTGAGELIVSGDDFTRSATHTSTSGATGGTENRPRSVALPARIKLI